MIKLTDLLKEIGDATKAVDYRKFSEKKLPHAILIEYEFKIGEDIYEVYTYVMSIEKGSKNTRMSIDFNLRSQDDQPSHYYSDITNKGAQYTIMATITKILKDYISQHPELVEIYYEPVKKDANDQGREKLYKVYAQKNLPDWSYSKEGDTINLRKPGYEPSKSIFKRFFNKK